MKKVISWISIITSGGWIIYMIVAELANWRWKIKPNDIESLVKFNIPLIISIILGFLSVFKIKSSRSIYKAFVYSLSSILLITSLSWLVYELYAMSTGERWYIKSYKDESVLKFLSFLIPSIILSIINLFDKETIIKEKVKKEPKEKWFAKFRLPLNLNTLAIVLLFILIMQNLSLSSEVESLKSDILEMNENIEDASSNAEQASYMAEEAKNEAEEAKDAAFANVCNYCPGY